MASSAARSSRHAVPVVLAAQPPTCRPSRRPRAFSRHGHGHGMHTDTDKPRSRSSSQRPALETPSSTTSTWPIPLPAYAGSALSFPSLGPTSRAHRRPPALRHVGIALPHHRKPQCHGLAFFSVIITIAIRTVVTGITLLHRPAAPLLPPKQKTPRAVCTPNLHLPVLAMQYLPSSNPQQVQSVTWPLSVPIALAMLAPSCWSRPMSLRSPTLPRPNSAAGWRRTSRRPAMTLLTSPAHGHVAAPVVPYLR